jgi:hypothetical protein
MMTALTALLIKSSSDTTILLVPTAPWWQAGGHDCDAVSVDAHTLFGGVTIIG